MPCIFSHHSERRISWLYFGFLFVIWSTSFSKVYSLECGPTYVTSHQQHVYYDSAVDGPSASIACTESISSAAINFECNTNDGSLTMEGECLNFDLMFDSEFQECAAEDTLLDLTVPMNDPSKVYTVLDQCQRQCQQHGDCVAIFAHVDVIQQQAHCQLCRTDMFTGPSRLSDCQYENCIAASMNRLFIPTEETEYVFSSGIKYEHTITVDECKFICEMNTHECHYFHYYPQLQSCWISSTQALYDAVNCPQSFHTSECVDYLVSPQFVAFAIDQPSCVTHVDCGEDAYCDVTRGSVCRMYSTEQQYCAVAGDEYPRCDVNTHSVCSPSFNSEYPSVCTSTDDLTTLEAACYEQNQYFINPEQYVWCAPTSTCILFSESCSRIPILDYRVTLLPLLAATVLRVFLMFQ